MNRKIFLMIALSGIFIFACGYGWKLKQGNEVIAKVEKFRNGKGRLPNNLGEIGIVETESGPIYYRKESETKFMVWFGKELGESATYDSDTKKWKNL
jgi:hypothetical protein